MKRTSVALIVMLVVFLALGATATIAIYDVPQVPGITGVAVRPGGVMEVDVVPTLTPQGHVATVDATFIPHIAANRAQGGQVVALDIVAPPLSTSEAVIPPQILREAAGMGIVVQTPVAAVEAPAAAIAQMAAAGRTLSIVTSSPGVAAIDAARPAGTVRIGSPVQVATNLVGDFTVTIPLGFALPRTAAERAAFLNSLRVFNLAAGAGTTYSQLAFVIDEAAVPPILTGVRVVTNRPGQFAVIR